MKKRFSSLVFNVLMGNGDAHIKNWSLIYDNPLRPRLAPAYDLVSTVAYTTHDTTIALNMAGVKLFRNITLDTFATLFTRIGLVDRIREEVMEEVRTTGQRLLEAWPRQFQAVDVPEHLVMMIEAHQAELPLTKALMR